MRPVLTLLVLLYLFAWIAANATTFEFTTGCNEAQAHIASLRLEKARQILKNEHRLHPDNVAADYLESYLDFYYMMVHQDEKSFRAIEKNKSKRIDRFKKLDGNNPFKLYAEAEMNIEWAYCHSMFDDYVAAALAIRTAYQLLEENHEKFPEFITNQKNLGLLKALIGTVPDNYKWLSTMAGMKGDFDSGLAMLRSYLANPRFKNEPLLEQQGARYNLLLLEMNFLKDKKMVWKHCDEYTSDFETNLASVYVRCYVGLQCDQNDEVIRTINRKPTGPEYEYFPAIDYLMGRAKFNRLDTDATVYFQKYVTFYKGRYLIKDAYRKLSWQAWFDRDTVKFNTYRHLSAKHSKYVSEEDQAIAADIDHGIYPDPVLIKARLLCDGGYYAKAEEMLKQRQPESLRSNYQKLEYNYRMARILHESNKLQGAIEYYATTIRLGSQQSVFFAPNACLQLGYIYEKLGYPGAAKYYFNKVFEYRNYEYKTTFQQKAKTALSQLK
jgi:hypothetical protein